MTVDLPYDVAIHAAEHLVQTGRMIPVNRWVDHLIEMRDNDENEGIF